MWSDDRRLPLPLFMIGGFYLFSVVFSLASYGHPFPFMGTFHQGGAAQRFVFGDSMICLYLVIGVWKRQRLTAWLIIAYNCLDVANACLNLALIPMELYSKLAGAPVPYEQLRSQTLFASAFLVVLNLYVYGNRRLFDNRSPYLF